MASRALPAAAHIEVYLVKKDAKDEMCLSYEIDDNDECICFSAFIFKDWLHIFYNHNDNVVIKILPNILEQEYKKMKNQVILTSTVDYKIQNLIKYIYKNLENYCGIKLIF